MSSDEMEVNKFFDQLRFPKRMTNDERISILKALPIGSQVINVIAGTSFINFKHGDHVDGKRMTISQYPVSKETVDLSKEYVNYNNLTCHELRVAEKML